MHNAHDQARKNPKYLKLLHDGVLDPSLLPLFWNKVSPLNYEMLVKLLVKFGLFVPLISDNGVVAWRCRCVFIDIIETQRREREKRDPFHLVPR